MDLLIASAFDVTATLALAFAAMPLLRRQSAALRHCVLAIALVSGAVLPLIEPVLPRWQVPVQMSAPVREELFSASAGTGTGFLRASGRQAQTGTPTSQGIDLLTAASRIWALGALGTFGALLFGFVRLAHLSRTARRVDDPRWLAHLSAVRESLGVGRPTTLLESGDPRFLVVWGVLRPRVLLPAVARDWSDARIRLVLTHELAHVQRGDWMVQCLAELIRVVHWFNPLVWFACARLRQDSDHACDDQVLASGIQGSEYASHLVDVARVLRGQRAWIPAPAIAHTTGFERRVQAMLNSDLDRRPLSRRRFAVTLVACLTLALPVAAFTATQAALVSFSGSVLDPSNAVLPNAIVTLTNTDTQAKYEVRTNREGRYEIPGLPAGRYTLESRVPGFETVRLELTVGAENTQRDLKLELGTIQQTITVATGGVDEPPRERTPEQKARQEQALRKRAEQRCPDGPRATPAIGGNIRVPLKLRDVRPVYPPALAANSVSGKAELQALIGTDGRVEQVSVRSATHAEFADAATEAVRQWEFDATLLNCVPVETRMNVTANFVQR
jgi:TonB family protein